MTPETLISIFVSAGTAVVAGLAIALQPALPAPNPTPVNHFQEADFQIYDHNFETKGQTCETGIQEKGICFVHSPLEDIIYKGAQLPGHLPAVSAEFPIILETPLKASHLQTVRFGHKVALYDPQTRIFVDVMDLHAKDFASAVESGRQKAVLAKGSASAS